MSWPPPVTLHGSTVILEPLGPQHAAGLSEAVGDGALWELWFTAIPQPAEMATEIERRLALSRAGSMLPFAVVERAGGAPIGMTTYMNVDAVNRRVEVGSTWYRKRAQRTAVNTECKLLLLTHAFETLECIAVEFRTSSYNFESRRAIERIGAKLDGVLRSHAHHTNGTLRDTYVYSIVSAEWPAVRAHLTARIASRTFEANVLRGAHRPKTP